MVAGVLSSPGSYQAHVKLEECTIERNWIGYPDLISYLMTVEWPTRESGLGEREYWMGNTNPWDAQV